MTQQTLSQQLVDIVAQWEGVRVARHRQGGVAFRVKEREMGHVHDDAVVDLHFSRRERRVLVTSGRALAHAALPDSGWVRLPLRTADDLPAVIDLLRRNYDRLRGIGRRTTRQAVGGGAQLVDDRYSGELPA